MDKTRKKRSAPRSGRRILFLGDFAYASTKPIVSGVIRHISNRSGVFLLVCGAHPGNDDRGYAFETDVDGVITCSGLAGRFARRLAAAGNRAPIVFVSQPCDFPSAAGRSVSLVCDDAAISESAASLLLRHGLASFGYVGSRLDVAGAGWDAARRAAFLDAIAAKGMPAAVYEAPQRRLGSRADFAALAAWLRELPKPCGLFVSYDQRALHVLNVCRAEGIAIPEEIQVIGVDNEEWICESTIPTLTSIEPDFEGAGRRAAESLLAMMDGAAGGRTETFGVRRVVQRMSTTDVHGSASRAVRARDYLRSHAGEPIGVAQLARMLNCSVRTLQTSYRTVFRTTLTDDLAMSRIEKAKGLLKGTKTPVGAIPEMIGYSSPIHFARLFKAKTGMSMLEYRRRASGNDRRNPSPRSSGSIR